MEVASENRPKKPTKLSPYDHYVVVAPEETGWNGRTIGDLRAEGCPECGRELTATGTCSKDLATYVRLSCMEHGLQPIFSLQKGKAYPVEE